MKNILLTLALCAYIINILNAKSDSLNYKNSIIINYAPSFTIGNSAKNVFHGIELSYERSIINRLSVSISQGFYTTTKKKTIAIDNNLNFFNANRRDYYLNTFITINAIPYYNNFYSLKIGAGPTLSYRRTLWIKSTDNTIDFNKQYYDKGVFGGLNINIQNDFIVKQHILINFKFESHFIFPKKNIGDKQFILRPSIGMGYKF